MAPKGKRDPNFPMQGRTGGMGGRYGSKSTNLTAKQLKAAGAAKAAKKRTVSVSETRREGSRTLGPKGKPLTGTVTLADGSKAVYRNGRRVQAADARKPRAAVSRPAVVVVDKGKEKGKDKGVDKTVDRAVRPKAARRAVNAAGRRTGQVPSATRTYANGARPGGRPASPPAGAAKPADRPKSSGTYDGRTGMSNPTTGASASAPNKNGDRRTYNTWDGQTRYEVYYNGKWIRT